MYPIKLERDTNIIDWSAFSPAGWCTTFQVITATNQVRSDGTLYTDYAVMGSNLPTGAIPARQATFVGIHMAAPAEGDEFTCYQITARIQCDDPTVRPLLIVGEAQSVGAAAGGDPVKETRLLDCTRYSGAEGASLRTDMTVALATLPTVAKTPCFALGVLAGTGASASLNAFYHLAVRRLIGVAPTIIDMTKQ